MTDMTERRSTKHGPMLDDEIADEIDSVTRGAPVESRAREDREQEGPADTEPTPDERVRGQRGSQVVDLDALELRADIARYLNPSVFPADRSQILESARANHAPEPIFDLLESLPEGFYENLQVVWEGLGGTTEQRA